MGCCVIKCQLLVRLGILMVQEQHFREQEGRRGTHSDGLQLHSWSYFMSTRVQNSDQKDYIYTRHFPTVDISED
jgi:hypothetical protein